MYTQDIFNVFYIIWYVIFISVNICKINNGCIVIANILIGIILNKNQYFVYIELNIMP